MGVLLCCQRLAKFKTLVATLEWMVLCGLVVGRVPTY